MSNVNLLNLKFKKKDLKFLKEEECVFLFQIGGILQEVTTLQKLIIMSSRGVQSDVERMAENSQAMYFFRLLASILHASWEVLCHRKYEDLIDKYMTSVNNVSATSFNKFKSYFSNKKNICTKIRNNYMYHYNYGKVASAYQKYSTNDLLEIYLSDAHANCRYLACDVVQMSSMLDIGSVNEFAQKLPSAIEEIMKVAKWFMEFSGEFLFIILSKIKMNVDRKHENISINNPPCIDELRLHYFFNRSEKQ